MTCGGGVELEVEKKIRSFSSKNHALSHLKNEKGKKQQAIFCDNVHPGKKINHP